MFGDKAARIAELEVKNASLLNLYSEAMREAKLYRDKLEQLEKRQKVSVDKWDQLTPILREINGQKVWHDKSEYGYILPYSNFGERYTHFGSLVDIVLAHEERRKNELEEAAEREKIAKIAREECFAAPKGKKRK